MAFSAEARMVDIDASAMQRALELAARGIGLVSPNPLVGCVITDKHGEVVGEGTYLYEHTIHAEIVALEQADDKARGGTAYISLEPHDHHGKTPPCTDALIEAGISRVVCPIEDPNPKVRGRGFEKLRAAGIEVVTGILADEASRLNEKFICWHEKKRPFVHLKLAMSLDGRISVNRSVSTALSSEASRGRVQVLRHEYDAILVGGNTAAVDDPSLTDRSGNQRRRPLARLVLDNSLQIPVESKLVQTAKDIPTLVFTNSSHYSKIERLIDKGVEIIRSDAGGRILDAALAELYRREIQSILVEGGSQVAGSFIDAGLVDKVTFLFAPMVIGGREAPVAVGGEGVSSLEKALHLRDLTVFRVGEDMEITGYPAETR